ncbi:MAG TPA: nuclear transport factor 2 family protein [Pyrinomonadaceae bacterium]|jgi:ketosteroid isomerase-like protein
MKKAVALLLVLLLAAVAGFAQQSDVASERNSLVQAERSFAGTATEKGIRDAFLAYLAEDAILFRPGPVPGRKWMSERPARPGLLTWRPAFADVSRAGDMGYTTGPWEFREKGPADEPVAYGHFVSVWKKQADGSWKVALDVGTSHPAPAIADAAVQFPVVRGNGKDKAKIDVESAQAALLRTEGELLRAVAARGLSEGFLSYMADDIRFYRDATFPVRGKAAVRAALTSGPAMMTWRPAAAHVSRSGDLGYIYGTYDSTGKPSAAQTTESGNYLRIWRKQPGGRWKVVLDLLNPVPPPKAAN